MNVEKIQKHKELSDELGDIVKECRKHGIKFSVSATNGVLELLSYVDEFKMASYVDLRADTSY